jgi:hypothetical protein
MPGVSLAHPANIATMPLKLHAHLAEKQLNLPILWAAARTGRNPGG